jgi:hypothetical protein
MTRRNHTHRRDAAKFLARTTPLTYMQALENLATFEQVPDLTDPAVIAALTTRKPAVPRPDRDARRRLRDLLEDGPGYAGAMIDGYTSEDVDRILGAFSAATGLNLICVWDFNDEAGTGGSSDFYVCGRDGDTFELAGDLWRYLNGDPGDPDSPATPGDPFTWVGAPAGLPERAYDAGHNQAYVDETCRRTCRHCDETIEPDPQTGTGWTHVQTGGHSGGWHCNPDYTGGDHTTAEPYDD